MQSAIYATFPNPSTADQAFVELLYRGVNSTDVLVITKKSYSDTSLATEDGRLDISENPHDIDQVAEQIPHLVPSAEDLLEGGTPFMGSFYGIASLGDLKFPGDLAERFRSQGVSDHIAQNLERAVLGGGALLAACIPSGPVEESQVWEVVERCGGASLARSQSPYLS